LRWIVVRYRNLSNNRTSGKPCLPNSIAATLL
jgi:hypothetical protein